MLRRTLRLLLSSGLLLLASCGPVAQSPTRLPPESAVSTPWPAVGFTETIRPQTADVRIQVFSGGRVPKLGHNHVLTVPKLQGRVWTPVQRGAEGARFELSFRLDELEVDPAALRAEMGPAFASVLDAEAIAGTRAHMLGPDNLEADRYPLVRIRSIRVVGEAPRVTADIEIELHGQRRVQTVPLDLQYWTIDAQVGWVVRGALTLRQSDFGIKPYSVLGGLLAVQDELRIEFVLDTIRFTD